MPRADRSHRLETALVESGAVATLTFSGAFTEAGTGSLIDGRYNLTIDATQFTADGFDGNSDGTAGDGTAITGSKANGLFRLFGDADGNGQIDIADFNAFRAAVNTTPGGPPYSPFDYDGSGTVDIADFNAFRTRFNTSVP